MEAEKLRQERLALWDRLLRGEVMDAFALERSMAPLLRSVRDDEKTSCVLIIAAAHVAWNDRTPSRRTLTAALRYWWSRSGAPHAARPPNFDARALYGAGVLEVTGLNLTWEEALASVGVRKRNVDHKSLHRVMEKLERRYGEVWTRVLGDVAPLPQPEI